MSDPVAYEKKGRVGVLVLNRPDKFNCISMAVLEGLDQGITSAEQDGSIRALVLLASGEHFCTGADLEEVRAHSRTEDSLDSFIGFGHQVMQRLELSALPVIAGVNGYCLAGGMELMMSADIVIAARDSRIGCQHSKYGLVPGWGGTQRLPRLVGLRRALDLMYSARWLTADEAQHWGLVNHVVAPVELESSVMQYAMELADRNPEGLAAMKRLAREGASLELADALRLEQAAAVPALRSENVAEGLRAFRDRREPVFK
jgi:enoyl-CoA hydratase/carnithine racemase